MNTTDLQILLLTLFSAFGFLLFVGLMVYLKLYTMVFKSFSYEQTAIQAAVHSLEESPIEVDEVPSKASGTYIAELSASLNIQEMPFRVLDAGRSHFSASRCIRSTGSSDYFIAVLHRDCIPQDPRNRVTIKRFGPPLATSPLSDSFYQELVVYMTITVRSMLMRLSTAHESLHLAPHNPSVTTESFSSPSANVNASSCSRQSLFHKLLSRFCQWKKESAEKSSSINDTHNPYVDSQDHFTLSICSDSPLDFTHSNGNESCEPSGVFNDSQQCSSYDRYQRHRSCSYFMPLLAYCLRKENRFLVLNGAYEHDLATALKLSTENWKIARWISGSISNYSGSHYKTCRPLLFLDWIRRLKIATQVAEALHFLHHICEPPIAHRDLTASSILLTDEFDIRMGYLEEARILDRGEAPAHDIYSYGKLLLQLVFGCETTRNIQPEDILGIIPPDLNDFMDLSNNPNQNSAFLHLIDPSLDLNEDLMKQVLGVASIAKSCMQACTKLSMDDISRLIQDPQHVNLEF